MGEKPPEGTAPATAQPGHNSAEDIAKRNLFFHHKRRIRALEEELRLIRNEVAQAKKLANTELYSEAAKDIKKSLKLDEQGGVAVYLSEVSRMMRIMRWQGTHPGLQGDFFDDKVGEEHIDPFERGVIAGLNGDPQESNPYPDEASQDALQWSHGYETGRRQYNDWLRARDAEDFDNTPMGSSSADPEDIPDAGEESEAEEGEGERFDNDDEVEALSDGPDEYPVEGDDDDEAVSLH